MEITTDRCRGAIGVDLNVDHLAVAETDASGNYVNAWRAPLVTYGKSNHQAEAVDWRRGGERGGVRAWSRQAHRHREAGLPPEKAVLEESPPVQPNAVQLQATARSRRTSFPVVTGRSGDISGQPGLQFVVGRVKFMERYGLTVHQAAALVLARRYLGCSERIPRRWVCPIGNGVQVAFTVPVRKRVKHVVDVLGCDLGAAETGACSAASAGEAETPTQSGSDCSAGRG